MNRNERITAVVRMLAATFNRQATEAFYAGYLVGLDGVPEADIESAAAKALATSKFMPSPAELRELCNAHEYTDDEKAVLAFGAVERAVSVVGSYGSPDFDDPRINAAIRLCGGWVRICGLAESEFDKWFRADFVKAYKAARDPGHEQAAPLIGLHQQHNELHSLTCEPAVAVRTGLPWAGESRKRIASGQRTTYGNIKV